MVGANGLSTFIVSMNEFNSSESLVPVIGNSKHKSGISWVDDTPREKERERENRSGLGLTVNETGPSKAALPKTLCNIAGGTCDPTSIIILVPQSIKNSDRDFRLEKTRFRWI